jgi:hypothetical protein
MTFLIFYHEPPQDRPVGAVVFMSIVIDGASPRIFKISFFMRIKKTGSSGRVFPLHSDPHNVKIHEQLIRLYPHTLVAQWWGRNCPLRHLSLYLPDRGISK